VPRNCVMAAL